MESIQNSTIRIKRIDLKGFFKKIVSSPKNILLTIFIGFILALLIYFIVFTIIQYRAELKIADEEIVGITLSNVTNGTATISWQTFKPQVGVVFYGTKDNFWPIFPSINKYVEYDDRDSEFIDLNTEILKEVGSQKRYTHHVTIEGLEAETTYYFRVGSGFVLPVAKGSDNSGFDSFTTGPTLNALYAPDPVYGKVLDEDEKPLEESIVYLTLVDLDGNPSSKLSTYVNKEGGFSIDVANADYFFSNIVSELSEKVFDSNKVKFEIVRIIAGPNYIPKEVTVLPDRDQPIADINLNVIEAP